MKDVPEEDKDLMVYGKASGVTHAIFFILWVVLTIRMHVYLFSWGGQVCSGSFLELVSGEEPAIEIQERYDLTKSMFIWINILINWGVLMIMFCCTCIAVPMYQAGYKEGRILQKKEDMESMGMAIIQNTTEAS